jgi:hypothetical protein
VVYVKATIEKAWGYRGDNIVAPDGLCYWFGERQRGQG